LLYAYMPETADRLLAALGEDDRTLASFGSRGGGQAIGQLAPLFPKIETAAA
jgi:methionyl-tRNA synthetase